MAVGGVSLRARARARAMVRLQVRVRVGVRVRVRVKLRVRVRLASIRSDCSRSIASFISAYLGQGWGQP